jgi:hypothetical protein
MSISDMVAEDLTKTFFIDKTGNKIMCDYSTVSSLNENENEKEDLRTKQINNLKTLKEISPEQQKAIDKIAAEIINDYGTEK